VVLWPALLRSIAVIPLVREVDRQLRQDVALSEVGSRWSRLEDGLR
jgi:hypothetical protein